MTISKQTADPFSLGWFPEDLDAEPHLRQEFEREFVAKWSIMDMAEALAHQNADARSKAIWFLGKLSDKRPEKALIWVFTNDPDRDNRGSAADWLGHLGTERAVTVLLDALQNDPHVEVRERAASGLRWAWKDKRVIDVLIAVMANKSEDPFVREMVADAISYYDTQKAALVLLESLSDPSPNVRYWAASALGGSRYEPAIPELGRLAREDTAICFEPNTQSLLNPQGLVHGSVCVRAAEAMISIKKDLKVRLTRKEREHRRRLKERAEKWGRDIEWNAEPGEKVTFCLNTTYENKASQSQF